MMRLALAAALLPAVAAAPTCTEESCCVPKVQGMCAGNTHDASGKKATDVGAVAADFLDVTCSGTTPENKGSTVSGRDAATCCQAATPAPAPAPATCATVTAEICGAGWIKDAGADAEPCVGTACDMTVEADKVACCTACTGATFALAAGTTCQAHTTAVCPIGKGWAGSNAADDGACTDCPNGKASDDTDDSACEDCAAGTIPTVAETSITAIVTEAATACSACAAGKFNTVATTDCAPHDTSTCPVGEGKVAGTASTDAACVACVVGSTWNNAVDVNACAANLATCGTAGEGLTVSVSASVNSACEACPVNTYAAAGDNLCKTDCADGSEIKDDSDPAVVVTTGGVTCTACAVGFYDDDGIPSEACAAVATGDDAVTTCVAGKGFVAASTTADAHCEDCVAGATFNNAADNTPCAPITPTACAAGKGYASDATTTTDDTAGACTACEAGKFSAGTQAVCEDCAAGKWSAAEATSCTDCASGTTVAAGGGTAADTCVARSEYCLAAMADDDTDTDTDGQNFACPDGKYVASDVMTEAVLVVAQCTAVPASTAATIIDAETTCTTVPAVAAVAEVIGVTAGTDIVLTGPDTPRALVDAVNEVTEVAAACTVATGGGECTLGEPVTGVASVATTCPEPVVEDKTTAGAATAAPLAVAAVLAAVFA